MWRKQEEEERDDHFDDYSEASKTKTSFQYEESFSWEEQAFAEDAAAAGRLGACVWPPTSYSCSFCRREFRSAQALGGHMNVHRRDRARLKQSPNNNNNPLISTTNSLAFQSPSSSSPHRRLSTLPNYLPPNPIPSPSLPNAVTSYGGRSDLKAENDEELRNSCSRVKEKDHVGVGILDEKLNFGVGQSRPMSGLFDDDDDDDREDSGAATGCKRRKMGDETSSIKFYVKSSSLVETHHRHHHIQSEVIGLSSTSLHDLDLELRLGGLSKG